ncbi:MAG: protein kinase domain-containing protein [Blastocatellia bacterium]
MDQERFEEIDRILEAALKIEPEARADFLKQACAGDDELRREVELLLSQGEEAEKLEVPAIAYLAEELAGRVDALQPGDKISHYRIESRIGRGGMGEVYLARDEQLPRQVAIKILPPEFSAQPERVRRFEQEARAVSALNHPNIITIFEIAQTGHDHFIAAEYVEGQTLREMMTGAETKQPRRLGAEQSLEIAIQIANALKAAHTAWIIHRDIKPENVMMRKDGLVKVLDFGIAKLGLGDGETGGQGETDLGVTPSPRRPVAPSFTVAGTILGTASYMSPEQARGETLDGRNDVFSLGATLYEMVTGERLMAGATLAEATAALRGEQEPLKPQARFDHAPKELERIIRKSLRRNREERYASAGEMLDELIALKRRLDNRASRRMVKLSALAILLAALFVAAAAWLSVNETWEERVMSDGHTAAVRRAVFSPDGRRLVSVGEDNRVIVWDFARRERLATFDDHTDRVTAVEFSPDGKWFVTAGADDNIIVWDAVRLAKTTVLPGQRGVVRAIVFSADGKTLVTPTNDGRKNIWEVGSWKRLRQVNTGEFRFGQFLLSTDGRWLMAPYGDIWDLVAEQTRYDFRPIFWGGITQFSKGARPPFWSWAAIAPDSRRIISIDAGGFVAFSETARFSDPHARKLVHHKRAHRDNGRAVAFSPDGNLAASGAEDIVLWDAGDYRKLARFRHQANVSSLAFSPDPSSNGRWLVSTHADGAILIWDTAEHELVADLEEHSASVKAVAFAPDGHRIASASEDGSVIIWDVARGAKEATLLWHPIWVNAVSFSADGKSLASSDLDGNLALWDVDGWRLRWAKRETKRIPSEASYCVAISPDGRWVATSYAVYESGAGRMIHDFRSELAENAMGISRNPQLTEIRGLTFSVDGQWLINVTARGEIALRRVGQWQVVESQRLDGRQLVSVSFSPDGKHLVTGEDGKIVQLWTAQPLRPIAEIGRHDSRVKSVAFSPDGKRVVSAGDDKMIALWDVGGRKLITKIGLHIAPVYSVAFSPDGKQLISGGHDHSVRLYTRRRSLWGFRLD